MMKIILVSVVGFFVACSASKEVNFSDKETKTFDVTIEATTTQAYCGGAQPTEEILDELNTPVPAPNVSIYLRKGTINDINKPVDYKLSTNDSGRVETQLPAGTYSVVFENKKNQAGYDDLIEKYGKETTKQTAIDTTCLKKHFSQPNGILEVAEKGTNKLIVNRRKRCQWTKIPCSNYKGQLPPSAPPR